MESWMYLDIAALLICVFYGVAAIREIASSKKVGPQIPLQQTPPATPAGASTTVLGRTARTKKWLTNNVPLENQLLVAALVTILVFYTLPIGAGPNVANQVYSWGGTGALLLILFYLLVLTWIAKAFPGKDNRWKRWGLMLLVLLPLHSVFLSYSGKTGEWSNPFTSGWSATSRVRAVAARTANGCVPQAQHSVAFGYEPVQINPEGRCGPDLWFEGHCVYVRRAPWTGDRAAYKNCGGRLPKDVEWVWTADTPFKGAVALVPPRYNF